MLTNIFTEDLKATRDIIVNFLGFTVEYEADWFVSMCSDDGSRVSAMLVTSEFIPADYQQPAQGVMLTFVVDDVEFYFKKAKQQKLTILEKPRNLPYGQRRLLIKDPSGVLIDISAPVAPLDPNYS